MCGIFGAVNLDEKAVVQDTFMKTLERINHRGPDDTGYYAFGNMALGIKRLKIIDIENGRQPMTNEDGSVVVVFNGEIYNFVELKEELERKGHKFVSRSDTEVIVHLFEEYGVDCLLRLNGMFSFALYEKRKKRLFLARDRVGIKPLYYANENGVFSFGSELKLFGSPYLSPRVSFKAVNDYLSFNYIPAPDTIYENIHSLPPGHYLTLDAKGLEIKQYWNLVFNPDYSLSEHDVIEMILDTLSGAVKRQLVSDVPLGFFLSSGMDSTSMIAFASRFVTKLKTFTVGYPSETAYMENEYAAKVAGMYLAEHENCILSEGDLVDILPGLAKHLDQPTGDWTVAGIYYVSKCSRQKITVSLSGTGGDESFGGYPVQTAALLARHYRKLPRIIREKFFKKAVTYLPVSDGYLSFDQKINLFIRGTVDSPEESHMRYREVFDADERCRLFKGDPAKRFVKYDPFDVFEKELGKTDEKKLMNRLLYFDFKSYLPDDTLAITDMATMLNSQECRVPFTDNKILELASKIPPEMKFKGLTTKYIFRKAMKKLLPKDVLKLPKRGFALPVAPWLKKKTLYSFVSKTIEQSRDIYSGVFDYGYIRALLSDHIAGKSNNARKISCLTSFFLWGQKV